MRKLQDALLKSPTIRELKTHYITQMIFSDDISNVAYYDNSENATAERDRIILRGYNARAVKVTIL